VIFKQEMIDKILAGEKSVTRRPVKYSESGKIIPCRYKVGKTYSLQPVIEEGPGKGRGGKSVGRIRIKSARVEQFVGINVDGEARLEGFKSAVDLHLYVLRLYPNRRIDFRTQFHRIEFEVVVDPEEGSG